MQTNLKQQRKNQWSPKDEVGGVKSANKKATGATKRTKDCEYANYCYCISKLIKLHSSRTFRKNITFSLFCINCISIKSSYVKKCPRRKARKKITDKCKCKQKLCTWIKKQKSLTIHHNMQNKNQSQRLNIILEVKKIKECTILLLETFSHLSWNSMLCFCVCVSL